MRCDNFTTMRELIVQFTEEHATKPRADLEKLVDLEVERFSTFMERLPDWKARGPLHISEKALIKSYLVAAVTGKLDGI